MTFRFPIFNVADLYDFHGFDGDCNEATTNEWVQSTVEEMKRIIEDVFDMKEAQSQRGNLYH